MQSTNLARSSEQSAKLLFLAYPQLQIWIKLSQKVKKSDLCKSCQSWGVRILKIRNVLEQEKDRGIAAASFSAVVGPISIVRWLKKKKWIIKRHVRLHLCSLKRCCRFFNLSTKGILIIVRGKPEDINHWFFFVLSLLSTMYCLGGLRFPSSQMQTL